MRRSFDAARLRQHAIPFLVSFGLAIVVRAITPYTLADSGERYRYVDMSRHFPITLCPSFHCFRFLPPLLTRLVPLPTIPAFFVTGLIFQALAGASVWRIAERLSGSRRIGLLSTLWLWGSWSSIQTLTDPLLITDPVQLFWSVASLELLLAERYRLALVMLVAGAAVKETVLIVPFLYTAYVFLTGERRVRRYVDLVVIMALPAVSWLAIRSWLSDHYWYALYEDPAYVRATYLFGYWLPNLSTWPRNLLIAAVYIFGAFGATWVLAVPGWRVATAPQRALTLASVVPMIFLVVYQVPDRGLASFPYAVLPLAAAATAQLSIPFNLGIIFVNAVFTERVAASAAWAPRLPVAFAALVVVLAVTLRRGVTGSPAQPDAAIR